jgi:chromatin remodeling complex protein RSC6
LLGTPMGLSADLAEIVCKKETSRTECVKQLWAYLKKHNLQDPENKQFFTPMLRWLRSLAKIERGPLPCPSSSLLTSHPPLKLLQFLTTKVSLLYNHVNIMFFWT